MEGREVVLTSARAFTEGKAFLSVEAGVFLLFLALLDGAWSGDWVRYDYISQATEQYMKSCSLQIITVLDGIGHVRDDLDGLP
ncbi:hypothetical protein NSK_007156 [Nannochloropsis salina CCMP1776]|uniref:DUF7887 domain-containing protein n=1 Tax=Nannochloropsis salina CCMP1776 TaxID=1027361 RepID=A0A4D9CVH3_9STRA|nr:hypothetical protein NSK_007156 [Nannochloropsis salina CCMP1776]|eukprot:TFJ81515.1 hypothetical protein NSK_007156 [Nannochloropsis salina CCMP1776]